MGRASVIGWTLLMAVMVLPPAMGAPPPPNAPAKGKAQPPPKQTAEEKAAAKELAKEKKGALPSCYQCKFQKDLEKEIKDNEAARDIYKREAERWQKEIDNIKAVGRGYPESRRQGHLDTYFNEGRDGRHEAFKKETKAEEVVSLETDPVNCVSDVVVKTDPKEEKKRKEKLRKFKKLSMCCQVFEWSVEHELNHIEACEQRKSAGKQPTAADLANEEAAEHQKQIDKLKDLLERAKDHCTNKKPTMDKYDEFCEGNMKMRIQDAAERLSRVAEAIKQQPKKPGKPKK